MVKKFIGAVAALSVASVLVLAGCSGGSRLTPAVGDGMSAPGVAMAPNAAGAITYKGPKVGSKPEVDLYSTTPATAGYSSTFTLTQSGFTGAFTYGYKPISGFTNNCPKTASATYAISPASGKKASKGKYTVKATAKGAAGACQVTFTGGAKKTLKVTLTFTTSGVVVGKPPSTH
ncbi:MAG TPA: hypothetical protein VFE36_05065 [Candidatus Baltobacteraceae bacterium]|nr:hypothetical protein [Candidatus Baltobacteraceae bacterium]